ncbi:membrane protein insertase YidC [Kordiimonas sediminis]|uniref:Membrane protein insertase YidC n=1 Tax=Kordiimonas sediminis TaxID=1735581 RepID=A0A919E4J9_9PROT|nr:membrane protein insertase YidC [Kordiimonas sediminis]GHF12396.1 membrane protein insertase YidC [Kordiimonas sediminis]
MGENKNLFIALGLSLLVMIGYDQLILQPQMKEAQRLEALKQEQQAQNAAANPDQSAPGSMAPSDDLAPASQNTAVETSAPAFVDAGSVRIETPELVGSLSLAGARFDDLSLRNHKVTTAPDSANIQLLKPARAEDAYFVRFGWSADVRGNDYVPGENTVWSADGDVLTPTNPVTLSWKNAEGLVFMMKVSVDDQFLFTVDQSVINTSGDVVSIAPYALINRRGLPRTEGMFILHEGPIGAFNDTLEERTYEDLEDDGNFETATTGGWMGITDKFWMTTLIPDQNTPLYKAALTRKTNQFGVYHGANYVQNWQQIGAGETHETTNHFYAGAKIVSAIDKYETALDIPLFDRTIDWGWFYFLTRPIFKGLHYLFELTGNFGVAILLLTVVVKLILFPLANKSYVSMSHMKKAQPKMKALQERYKDDKQKLQQEMMALYKKEKINPLAGCLPMLLQIPVFFALYKVLYVTIEMRHQPFVLWIKDLSAPDPLTPVNLFGLIPWDPPSFIAIGILPIMMGISMWATQKLSPQSASMDPTQQKVMAMLPIIFTVIMAGFSAGLVLYWTWNSVLSIAQQWYIMRREEARSGE